MNRIDAFLQRHEVDVGRSLGLLSLVGAVESLFGMLVRLLAGQVHINLSILFAGIIGLELWRHRPWARTVTISFCWIAFVCLVVALAVVPFVSTQSIKIWAGNTVIQNPSVGQIYVVGLLLGVVLWLLLTVLYSEKAKAEFKEPTSAVEKLPT